MGKRTKDGRGCRRSGAGRPALVDDPVRLTITVERRVLAMLEGEARRKGQTLAAFARAIVSRAARR